MDAKRYCLLLLIASFLSCKNTSQNEHKESLGRVDKNFQPYSNAQLSSGKLMRLDSFPSKYVTPRPVDVWLPENYSEDKKYAVLYMHDGQMLFDATSTWNKQEWKVDEWASKLMNEGKTKNFIVVAIHNIKEERWQDLFPEKAFANLSDENKTLINQQKNHIKQGSKLNGDNYLKFLVEEIKPIVDSEFSVYKNKENTFVMGSSMGGLMSMYAICEYPNVFGGASCMSTHWPGAQPIEDNSLPKAILSYLENKLPNPSNHKIYFDYGTETLDAFYPQYAPMVNRILISNGYSEENYKNEKFEGADHSENSWNKRLNVPLTFLLGQH
ncbi:esterase [Hyunsoonleella flava]|uniref:Esterase n=1 Tax=Hyunsoonleella flava TaxID=2527939 RepID=A0A4Q9FC87_9FLAO|nr:alpha/beta hydrolase-fold protein [Hyunsoonleella flava]TBN00892.1 esterase [Hyunsoonleella flava]